MKVADKAIEKAVNSVIEESRHKELSKIISIEILKFVNSPQCLKLL